MSTSAITSLASSSEILAPRLFIVLLQDPDSWDDSDQRNYIASSRGLCLKPLLNFTKFQHCKHPVYYGLALS